jgi:hypothetical protein
MMAMEKAKLLLKNKLFVRAVLTAALAAAGYSLPPESIDPLVSLLVGLVG